MLAARDFNDDTKDAGEIGAGHTVTALYEVVPTDARRRGDAAAAEVDPLKYQTERGLTQAAGSGELLTVKVRYKPPTSDKSTLLSQVVQDGVGGFQKASDNYRFSAGVALFGMILRESKDRSQGSLAMVTSLVSGALGDDPHGDRKEFLKLVGDVQRIGLSNRASALPNAPGARGLRVPRVRQAKAAVKGSLDRDIVRRIVRAHINEVRYCYNLGLGKDNTLQGRVVIQFAITSSGKVSSSVVESTTLKDNAVSTCIAKAVRRWLFPRPPKGDNVVVTYPFALSPG